MVHDWDPVRYLRYADERGRPFVDLHFDDRASAVSFRGALEQIWSTPQSKEQMVSHGTPQVYEIVVDRDLSGAAASTS